MAVEVEEGPGTTSEDEGSGAEDGLVQCTCKQAAGELEEYEDENQCLPSEDSTPEDEDEAGLTDEEINIISQATKLAMEQDEVPEDVDKDLEEDSDIGDDVNDEDESYIPNVMCGKHGTGSMSKTTPLTSKVIKSIIMCKVCE